MESERALLTVSDPMLVFEITHAQKPTKCRISARRRRARCKSRPARRLQGDARLFLRSPPTGGRTAPGALAG
jgi:hypothetical protein